MKTPRNRVRLLAAIAAALGLGLEVGEQGVEPARVEPGQAAEGAGVAGESVGGEHGEPPPATLPQTDQTAIAQQPY
jgi:hypothetical protein